MKNDAAVNLLPFFGEKEFVEDVKKKHVRATLLSGVPRSLPALALY